MSGFLVLSRLRFRHANALQAWWLLAPPSPMTVQGFVRALGRAVTGCPGGFPHSRIAIAHHSVQWLAATKPQWRYGKNREGGRDDKDWDVAFWGKRLIPQQIQGASYIDEKDHIASGFAKSLQPTARCHGEISVVIEVGNEPISLDAVKDFLWSARLGGGAIAAHGTVVVCASFDEVIKTVGGGFWVTDRSDLVAQVMGQDGLDGTEALIRILATNSREQQVYAKATLDEREQREKPESWLSANVIGYAALEPLTKRIGVREGLPHAYAEPLVGLVRYRSLRENGQIPFWSYHTRPEKGVYLMTGQTAPTQE